MISWALNKLRIIMETRRGVAVSYAPERIAV